MSKPYIVLVPGSFGLPVFYADNVSTLIAKGYYIDVIHMPSIGLSTLQGRPGPPATMNDDATFIAEKVERLADEGKDVVLIGHSYGGVPMTQSVKGLSKEERTKQGKAGGLVRMGYLTCLVPEVGKAAKDVLGEAPPEQTIPLSISEDGWMHHEHPETTARITLSSMSVEKGAEWIRKMPKHSAISFVGELTYPGYKDVPISYLLCEDDLCIPRDVQQAGIDVIERASGKKVDVTSIKADHCPNVTAPQAVVDWVVNVVERASAGHS
ncbi:hypothetical protein LTR05_003185 [Lithohypha guttulata]|uniref:AB hydrolase-1 domain-containing protein n=1 Tax=Lithohypha guttulata TaxID=1690604 RepID=A0AAN7T3F8_9EURO|nr:hypothetical protein LTR05_003185 [Lithohypha guttulata]